MGTLITSPDATTWTPVAACTTNALLGVAYGNGRFVAVGGSATAATILDSVDGINWSVQDTSSLPPLRGITAGAGQFVAVGRTNASGQGTVVTSPDGTAWTIRSPTTTNNLLAVAYGSGTYVGTGSRGAIIRSADGIAWTDVSQRTPRAIHGVAYGSGWWVTVTTAFGHYVSTDTRNWAFRDLLWRTTGLPTHGIAFADNSFFVVGSAGQILESAAFTPSILPSELSLIGNAALFLKLKGNECCEYEIEIADRLPSVGLDLHSAWQPFTRVSNVSGTVTLPLGSATNVLSRFYRASGPR